MVEKGEGFAGTTIRTHGQNQGRVESGEGGWDGWDGGGEVGEICRQLYLKNYKIKKV